MANTYMKQVLQRFAVGNTGQDLLEYALLASLIALVAVGGVTSVGTTIKSVFWAAIAAANV